MSHANSEGVAVYINFVPHFYYSELCSSSCKKMIRDEKDFIEYNKVNSVAT